MDATPAMLIFGPVLLPLANQLGIDSIHFGMIMICNLMIGLITPPVGALLLLSQSCRGSPLNGSQSSTSVCGRASGLSAADYLYPLDGDMAAESDFWNRGG